MESFKLIPLTGHDGKGKFTKVSTKHYEQLNKSKWFFKDGRIRGNIKGETIYLNIYVWFLENGEMPTLAVDHINRDPLDNTIENLRLATVTQNGGNRTLSARNTTGCKCVSFSQKEHNWVVLVAGERIGSFSTIQNATEAAKKTSTLKYGEFANCETNEENLEISRKFDQTRKSDSNLDYQEFFKSEKAKIPASENLKAISTKFKQVKEQWEKVKDCGLYKQIFLNGNEASNGEFIIVDASHYDLLSNKSICLREGSPMIHIDNKTIRVYTYILRDIMGQEPNDEKETVDHINRIVFDCRGSNLRYATQSQQNANQGLKSNNTSGFKGLVSSGNRWIASIGINKKGVNLGSFLNKRHASFVYDTAAKLFFGNIATVNYELRNGTDALDFGNESLTKDDLQEILNVMENPDRKISDRDIFIPSLIPCIGNQLEVMKKPSRRKRSSLTPIEERLNNNYIAKKAKK